MSIAAIVEALVAAGATPEMILAAVRAAEGAQDDALQARRASDAERARRYRQRHVTSRDVTVTERDAPASPGMVPSTLPPHPYPDSPLNPPTPPAAADAREPEWVAVGRRVLDAMGVKFDDPRWAGSLGLVSQWLADGCDPEMDILPTVRALMAKRGNRGPPNTLKFFAQAIADAKADRVAPMPTATATTTTRPKHAIIAALDQLDDHIAAATSRHRG